jgi:hypothetical protein
MNGAARVPLDSPLMCGWSRSGHSHVDALRCIPQWIAMPAET